MMETAAEDQVQEANNEVGLEDDTIKVIPDEEFDFDIGGPEDNMEALGVFESTDDGLKFQAEGNDALDDAHTYSTRDQGTLEAADEPYEDETVGQDEDQHNLEVSAFDASVATEVVDQTENENTQQADQAQYGESEKYQEEIDFEETTEELGNFADAGQQDEGLIQTTTISAESVEYSHPEQDHFEDGAHDGDASAQETAEVQAEDETEPPVESSYVNEAIESEAINAEPRSEGNTQDKSFEHDPDIVGTVATEVTTGAVDGFEDASDQNAEASKRSEEHPRVRVSYGTAEFYLFAVSADADPDDYFFENADILDQPLSQFLSSLRQVISEDLQASDELLVKVDGMGIEFGEATTKDFLEQTSFGQVLELYERLVKLDDNTFESPELYIYLETRPNCLHRLTELTNDAKEGKGLSQVAFYYEGTPDLAAVEEESNEYDEGLQGLESDDVSLNDPNDQIVGDSSASRQTEQPYNPFRLSESQQQAINASHPGLIEGEVTNEQLSVDADGGHPAYDDNQAHFSGEVQDDLELEAADALRETSADRTQEDTDILPGDDDEYLVAEDVVVESESQHYAEEGVSGREEVAGTEAISGPGNEHFQEDDGPTDGENLSSLEFSGCTASSEICDCARCMSGQPASTGTIRNALVESAITPQVSDRRLVDRALTDVHQALVTTADWSSNFLPTASTQDQNKHKQSTSADFKIQDYNAAENDDYLDIGATEEEPAESAGTPGPTSQHNSSATATLDGESHGNGDDASATEALEDAGPLVHTPPQAGVGSPETDTDEIHWNDDDEIDEEVDFANQNQTDLSPSSLSVKRGRQADEDDVGLGDDSSKSSSLNGPRVCANIALVAKRRRT